MRTLILPALLSVFAAATASAITDAEIAPAALVGKTLVFDIENGASPFATTGTWSGTFASSGNGFSAANISGDFVDISTTFSAALDGTFTNVSLAKIVEGQKPATLTLYTISGVGHYEVSIQDLFGANMSGTFTFGSAPKLPEIDIQQPAGKSLKDGGSAKSFGQTTIGTKSKSMTFTIVNKGKAKLTGLALSKSGRNKKDFAVTSPLKENLAPGASTTFKVTFKPSAAGGRSAAIAIGSNDADENPFNIKLSGEGAK